MLKPVATYFFILFGIHAGFFLFFIYIIFLFLIKYGRFTERKLSLTIFPKTLINLLAFNCSVSSRKYVRANGLYFGSFRMINRAARQAFGIFRIFKRINRQAFVKLRMIKRAAGQCFGNSRIYNSEGKQAFGKLFLIKCNQYQNKIISRIFVAAGFHVFLSALCQFQFSVITKNQKFNTL